MERTREDIEKELSDTNSTLEYEQSRNEGLVNELLETYSNITDLEDNVSLYKSAFESAKEKNLILQKALREISEELDNCIPIVEYEDLTGTGSGPTKKEEKEREEWVKKLKLLVKSTLDILYNEFKNEKKTSL